MGMDFKRRLPIPQEIKQEMPMGLLSIAKKREFDAAVARVMEGADPRKLLVIGPCSADNEDTVLDYCTRLAAVRERVAEKLILIPRLYTNKPRTLGIGYMGMLHQPNPDGEPNLLAGIRAIRRMNLRVIEETGLYGADEMLYPEYNRFISDLLSYVAVGARSVENQQHRLTASGIDVPVGMKNPTGGDLGVMMNSIMAAQSSHTFLYRGWEVTSEGNPCAHALLRGYVDFAGRNVSNYHYEDLLRVEELYGKSSLVNPSVIVDVNHSNSGKKYLEQIRIAKDVVRSRNQNPGIKRLVKGLMIESYLEDGAQGADEHVFGKSITDPCLGWEKTERLIFDLAERL